uniref:Uncharacterized protein n=1 Tax=Populus trichocarpa TaxID=3694 RepID=A9PEP2_POPTR|nr:unknown [Populus trichocarpa]
MLHDVQPLSIRDNMSSIKKLLMCLCFKAESFTTLLTC